MIRQWIDERRVGPDYLVWREGWPEWRRAAVVFPKLAALGAATAAVATAGSTSAGVDEPTSTAPQMEDDWVEAIIESQSHATHHKPRPKPSKNNNLLMIISFLVVLLGVMLVVVVIIAARKQGSNAPPNNPPASTTTASLQSRHWIDNDLLADAVRMA